MKFINVPIFIISLAIGLFMCYITTSKTEVIFVYPTPDNIDKILYKDYSDTCYRFDSQETKCPSDSSKINKIPIQVRK